MPYTYHTDDERRQMLEAIGVSSLEELFDQIPREFYLNDLLPIAPGMTEPEALREFSRLGRKNNPAGWMTSFLGGGIYDHVVPSVVRNLTSRPEFATAYTPYQPEVSQGTLAVIFEFQTHISRLTGLPVANASLYDGATAVAEACLMAAKIKRRDRIVYPNNLNPRYLRVVESYVRGQDIKLTGVDFNEQGTIDESVLRGSLGDDVAGVIVQTPNYFGGLESPWNYVDAVHDSGALLIACVDPLSLSVFREPGSYGADLVVGEAQVFGNDMNFGGPVVGIMACQQKLIRQMPGRIVSRTKDVDGKDAFVLTLQTREQHIRRDKATSNICTNQGLLATRATIYLSLIGERGIKELGTLCHQNAATLAAKIEDCEGYSVRFDAPYFREFVVRCPGDAADVARSARADGILAGIPLSRYYGEVARDLLLVAVTEKHTDADFDDFCDSLKKFQKDAVNV